jgi:hypothetical protein
MRKITKKTAVIVAGSALLVAIGGGIAFAYWSSTGQGTGSATTSAGTSPLTISPAAGPTDLAPGVAPEALTGTIANGGTSSAYVNSLTVTITGVTGGASGCTSQDYGLTTGSTALVKGTGAPQTITVPVGRNVDSGSSTTFPTVNIGFANDPANNQDACEGATPQLSYSTN